MSKLGKKFIVALALTAVLVLGLAVSSWAISASATVTVTVSVADFVGLSISNNTPTFNVDLSNPIQQTSTHTITQFSSNNSWNFSYTASSDAAAGTGWLIGDNKLAHSAVKDTGNDNNRVNFANANVAASGSLDTNTVRTGGNASLPATWPTSTMTLTLTPVGTEASGTFTYTLAYTLTAP